MTASSINIAQASNNPVQNPVTAIGSFGTVQETLTAVSELRKKYETNLIDGRLIERNKAILALKELEQLVQASSKPTSTSVRLYRGAIEQNKSRNLCKWSEIHALFDESVNALIEFL